jgi:hypothetical protein
VRQVERREGKKGLVLPGFARFFHGAGGTGAYFTFAGFPEEADSLDHRPGYGGCYDDEGKDLLYHIT